MKSVSSYSADKGLDQQSAMIRAGTRHIISAHQFQFMTEIAYEAAAFHNEDLLNDTELSSINLSDDQQLISHESAEQIARDVSSDIIGQGKRIIDASMDAHLLALL